MTRFIVRGDLPKEPALRIEKQLILSPGVWKGQKITPEAIKNGINNTNWEDKENLSVIYGHRDHNDYTYFGDPSPEEWLGNISKPEYLTLADGVPVEGMYADFNFFDENLSRKIAYGGVRCGISAGMEYDYRSGQIKRFTRQSVVKNPACKKAFLNLADEDSLMDTMEPTFLTLADEPAKDHIESIERRIDDKSKMDENLSKLEDENKLLKEKITELEKANAKAIEPKVEDAPKKEVIVEEPKTEEKKQEVTPEPKVEEKKPEPIVIEKETIKEVSDNTEVVKAINDMSNKFSEEVKKLAEPATTAATNPNATGFSEDNETTKKLVDRYLDLHPEKNE